MEHVRGWLPPTPPNVRQQRGLQVEILIRAGKVKATTEAIDTPQAKRARGIANFLPIPNLHRYATIVHNEDDNTTSIRFDTQAGPIRLVLPVADGFEFHIIHDGDTGPRILDSIPSVVRGTSLSVRAVAFRVSEFLRTRGLM